MGMDMLNSRDLIVGLLVGIVLGSFGVYVFNSKDVNLGQISQLEGQIVSLQELIDTKNVEISGYQTQISTLEGQVIILQSQVSTKTYQINTLQSQVNNLTSQITTLQQTIDTLESQRIPSPPSEGEAGSSRFFPANIGVPLTYSFDYLFDEYTVRVTVIELIRGNEAWTMIEEANISNDPPSSGFEYVLVKIKFEYLSGPTIDTTFDLSTYTFDVVSGEGYVYEITVIIAPDPTIDAELYFGASHEGWAGYQIYTNDTEPVLACGRDYSGEGGIWFKLYEEA